MLYTSMLHEKQRLERELEQLHFELPIFPAGYLSYSLNGNYTKWYHHIDRNKKYITKDQHQLAVQLALKRHNLTKQEDLKRKLKGIEAYLQTNNPALDKADALLAPSSKYAELLLPALRPISKELSTWAATPYERSTSFPEQLHFKTESGLVVRSKSEAIIAMKLAEFRIPFRYECTLNLSPFVLHPDFTIRHPRTGETYYWEHFGKMDSSEYQGKMLHRLQIYMNHSIVPAKNLIMTFESGDKPLSISEVIHQIQQHFL